MSEYRIIAPPFTLEFRKMSKQELCDYNAWFLAQIPERIVMLEEAVNNTRGFENWKADYTPESLDLLGEWFARQVETRERTEEEIQELQDKAPPRLRGIEYDRRELTNKTFSLAIDIGMYLSQVFLKTVPSLKWQHTTKGVKTIDYGQPVLASFGRLVFNPVRMLVALAYGIAKGNRSGVGLRELFEIWKKLALA